MVTAPFGMKKSKADTREINEIFDRLCHCIGVDVKKLYLERPCKDQDYILQYNVSEWLRERPAELVIHLRTLGNLNHSPRSNYLLAKLIEQLHNCRNSRLVLLPLSFREN